MSEANFPTREQLRQRRAKLRQDRQKFVYKQLWRFGLTAGILGGLVYLGQLPNWLLQSSDQIQIEGHQLLSAAQVRDYVPLEFPRYVWHVQPKDLERQLTERSLIRQARVQRQLVPPQITIWVEERQPVAQAMTDGVPGVVDRDGLWIPLQTYANVVQLGSPPPLRLIGWEFHQPADWAAVLAAVAQSPVPVKLIDWQASHNLVFQTELGLVHLGTVPEGNPEGDVLLNYLNRQLQALDQMRNLPAYCQCNPADIAYIDLRSPEVPTIELTEGAAQQRFSPSDDPLPALP